MLLASAAPAPRATADPIISEALIEALETEREVPVIVFFRAPDADRLEDAADARRARRRARRAGAARAFVSKDAKRALALRREALLRGIPDGELRIRHRFRSLNAFSATLTRAGLERLRRRRNILRIDLDLPGGGTLEEARAISKLDDVQTDGFTGDGVSVAMIDSGVDLAHVDVGGAVVAEQCYCSGSGGCCPNNNASQSGSGAAQDDHGHGSHVTGIVTSNGGISPLGGAPDADIVAVKVLDENNTFQNTSDVIMGLDWVVDEEEEVRVVNMSLATNLRFLGDCDNADGNGMAFSALVATLRDRGAIVVAASGNNASGLLMPMPACIADVISVGATYDDDHGSETWSACTDPSTAVDQVTCFSNSNDKTDLFAPGAKIVSVDLGSTDTTMSGTSMAAPLVSACAATLIEAFPVATASQLEKALESSPVWVTDSTNGLDFPRLDCAQAHVKLDLLINPPPVVPALRPLGIGIVCLILVVAAGPRLGREARRSHAS